jgi:hypothetical protein
MLVHWSKPTSLSLFCRWGTELGSGTKISVNRGLRVLAHRVGVCRARDGMCSREVPRSECTSPPWRDLNADLLFMVLGSALLPHVVCFRMTPSKGEERMGFGFVVLWIGSRSAIGLPDNYYINRVPAQRLWYSQQKISSTRWSLPRDSSKE